MKALTIIAVLVVAVVAFVVLFSRITRRQSSGVAALDADRRTVPDKTGAIVEVRSGTIVAFDLPFDGARYKISDFRPGLYRVPLEAIVEAPKNIQTGDQSLIDVDTGVICFIDADYREKFREIENRLWEETEDSYEVFKRSESVSKELGIKFDYLESPGIGSGFAFVGDGTYVLDLSKVERVSQQDEKDP